jgi:hypothetical protein
MLFSWVLMPSVIQLLAIILLVNLLVLNCHLILESLSLAYQFLLLVSQVIHGHLYEFWLWAERLVKGLNSLNLKIFSKIFISYLRGTGSYLLCCCIYLGSEWVDLGVQFCIVNPAIGFSVLTDSTWSDSLGLHLVSTELIRNGNPFRFTSQFSVSLNCNTWRFFPWLLVMRLLK